MGDQKPPMYDANAPTSYPPQNVNPAQQPYPPQHVYPAQQPYPPQQVYPGQQPYPPQYPIEHQSAYPAYQQCPPMTSPLVPPPSYEEQAKGQVNFAGPEYEGQHIHDDLESNYPPAGDVRGIANFSDKSIRLGFIRKVFAILALQMAVTVAMTAWFLFHEPTKVYVQNSLGLYIASYCLFLVLYFVLVCCTTVARKHPINLILLGVFTLSMGYLVAAISSFHDTPIVMAAFGMTIFCCGGVILFASQTKYDLTKCSGVLFCCAFTLLLFGIFGGILVPMRYMRLINVVYASLGALLFMGFLAFDVQLLMGGHKYELSPEDYVFAALQLYVDVIYIFLFILQIFGGGK